MTAGGGAKAGKTAAARSMNEWQLPVSGFGIGSGSTSSATVVEGGDGVGDRWLMGLQQLSADLWVLAAGG